MNTTVISAAGPRNVPRESDFPIRLKTSRHWKIRISTKNSRQFSLLLMMAWLVIPVAGADWPQWRGPQRDGISREAGLLDAWPAGGPPQLWKTQGLGQGYA